MAQSARPQQNDFCSILQGQVTNNQSLPLSSQFPLHTDLISKGTGKKVLIEKGPPQHDLIDGKFHEECLSSVGAADQHSKTNEEIIRR